MPLLSSRIEDPKLAHVFYREFLPYVRGIERRELPYSPRKFFRLAKKLKQRWESYAKRAAKRLVYRKAKFYGFKKRELFSQYKKIYLQNIIAEFTIKLDRSFAQAQHAIERNLDIPPENKGFFGLPALYSLKRKKLEKPGPIEGFSRLKQTGGIYHLRLESYVKLLIITGQAAIGRRAEEIVSFQMDHDLVWVDPHPCWLGPKANEVCNRWRDRILSLHGTTSGFPKMQEATSERPPLFHPNCTHSYHALTDRQATVAVNQEILFFSELTKFIGRS